MFKCFRACEKSDKHVRRATVRSVHWRATWSGALTDLGNFPVTLWQSVIYPAPRCVFRGTDFLLMVVSFSARIPSRERAAGEPFPRTRGREHFTRNSRSMVHEYVFGGLERKSILGTTFIILFFHEWSPLTCSV